MINCQCPKCAESFEVQNEYLGQTAKCPYCAEIIVLQATPIMGNVPPASFAQYNNYNQPAANTAPQKSVAPMILGIIGLVAWLLPIIGLPVTITGLILGICKKSQAGIVLNVIGLVLSLVNSIYGAILGSQGKLFFQ